MHRDLILSGDKARAVGENCQKASQPPVGSLSLNPSPTFDRPELWLIRLGVVPRPLPRCGLKDSNHLFVRQAISSCCEIEFRKCGDHHRGRGEAVGNSRYEKHRQVEAEQEADDRVERAERKGQRCQANRRRRVAVAKRSEQPHATTQYKSEKRRELPLETAAEGNHHQDASNNT